MDAEFEAELKGEARDCCLEPSSKPPWNAPPPDVVVVPGRDNKRWARVVAQTSRGENLCGSRERADPNDQRKIACAQFPRALGTLMRPICPCVWFPSKPNKEPRAVPVPTSAAMLQGLGLKPALVKYARPLIGWHPVMLGFSSETSPFALEVSTKRFLSNVVNLGPVETLALQQTQDSTATQCHGKASQCRRRCLGNCAKKSTSHLFWQA